MTLSELRTDFQNFAAGDLEPEALARKLQALIVTTPIELALDGDPLDGSVADQLVARLVFHFEDPCGEPEVRRQQARTIVAALKALAPEVVLPLLPTLFMKERLTEVVQKHQMGIVSRTSFVGAVGSARLPPSLQRWLYAAPPSALEQFAACLRADDLRQLQQITGLAAA
jgi:hypothetical protein